MLSEQLQVNRNRFLARKSLRGLRQIELSSQTDQENRRLTTLRKEVSQTRTRFVNKIKYILRRYNLQLELPTKTYPSTGHRLARETPSTAAALSGFLLLRLS